MGGWRWEDGGERRQEGGGGGGGGRWEELMTLPVPSVRSHPRDKFHIL